LPKHPSMTLRCDWPSCKALRFDSTERIVDHSYNHLEAIVASAEHDSTFRCSWHGCASQKRKVTTFKNFSALNRHLKQHIKEHWCINANCNVAFARESDLKRHIRSKHSEDRSYRCPIDTCDRSINGFARKDKLNEHTRKEHANFRCNFDHCEVRVLESEMNDHLIHFHSGKDTAINQHEGTFECSFAGCESTKSKFTYSSANNHLRAHHLIYYESTTKMLSQARLRGPIALREGAFVITDPDRIRFSPCNNCNSCPSHNTTQTTQPPAAPKLNMI